MAVAKSGLPSDFHSHVLSSACSVDLQLAKAQNHIESMQVFGWRKKFNLSTFVLIFLDI